jgi:RHH-type proline utilization regulon transcriptional repressor/proline dehydrogenase/delta 1-pyrroline-5-carboxylate dehydrogenase
VEADLQRIGRELAEAFPARGRNPLKALDDRAMDLASRDGELRAALFRLVDVTPACRTLDDLARHLGEYLAEVDDRTPQLGAAMRAADSRAGRKALGAAAAAGVRHMAHRFIVGESPKAALRPLRSLHDQGILTTVDLLGEATVTAPEADRYAVRCAEALETLAGAMESWPGGPEPNLSVKVSALTPLLRPDAPELGRDDAAARLRPLLASARDLGAHLHVDMESLDSLETTLELVFAILEEDAFRAGPSAGLVLQAYLRDSPQELDRILEWARASGRERPLTIRLVKGAYWDHEVVEARQHGWSAPVFETKAECDRNFEELTRRLLDARPLVRVAVASHNLRSVAHALAYAGDRDLEVQILRGLGDDLAHALASRGVPVRAYCPVGDLVAGMAYLVRRLLENTANESFLNEQARGVPVEELLAAP